MSSLIWGDVLADSGQPDTPITGTLAPEIQLPSGTYNPATSTEGAPDRALDVSSWDGLLIQVHSRSNVPAVFMPIELTIQWYSSLPRIIDPSSGFSINRMGTSRIRKWCRVDTTYYVKNRGPYALIWVTANLAQNTPGTARLIVSGTNSPFPYAGPYTPSVFNDLALVSFFGAMVAGGTADQTSIQDYAGPATATLRTFNAGTWRLETPGINEANVSRIAINGTDSGSIQEDVWVSAYNPAGPPGLRIVGPAGAIYGVGLISSRV